MELNDIVKLQVNGNDIGNVSTVHYGTCETAGGTAAKTASIDGLILSTNALVAILFVNAFEATNPTLNINGSGAKPIYLYGSAIPVGKVRANTILTMVYDGVRFNTISVETYFAPTEGAVDMGLPSGVLWCDHNVGATSSTEQGYFFSWGNVSGHCLNGVGDYDFGTATSGEPYASSAGAALTGNIPVGTSYDMVRKNMGTPWRLPTRFEFQELYDNSNTEWTTVNSVAGRLFTSKTNGNSIFFPAAGYYNGSSHYNVGSSGYYWSSSFNSADNAYSLYFYSSVVFPQDDGNRFYGFSVRAVQ